MNNEEKSLSILDQNEASVRQTLAKFLNLLYPNVKWASHTLRGFGKIDVFATFPTRTYIIEIELKREDPVNNIAKIYRCLEEDSSEFQGKKVIFVHAFSPHYSEGGALTKRKNAEFIGNKMSEKYEDVAYLSIEFDSMKSLKNRVLSAIRSKYKNL